MPSSQEQCHMPQIDPTGAQAEPSDQQSIWILVVLSALMAFASISTDLYLPAMPAMALSLHANAGQLELTISGYLVGFSLGQLLWGPVGDRYGRRLPVALGLLLFIAGSAGCALSDTAQAMITWRAVQAVGACASVVLARAMIRDLYEGHRAAQMLSTLMTVMAVAPLLGPTIGGLILKFGSWHLIFWALAAFGLATLAALYTIPETLPKNRRNHAPLSGAFRRYKQLLADRRLLGYASAGGFFYGGMYAYIAGTPFAYIDFYHVSPQAYGLLFGAGIVGIMIANQVNARLVRKLGSDRLLRLGTLLAGLSSVWLAADAWGEWAGLAGLVVPLFVFVSAAGLIIANSIVGALNSFPQAAGSVSALIGALQYGTGILGSGLVGAMADGTPKPMAWVIALFGLASMVCAWFVIEIKMDLARS
ncbi:MFS transporter [Pseudomonas savastanoi pv. nerii]|uniref:Bcr/CflA family efflux transporter n=3 Tax=Pseudomonas savastanoi TaxID=29438 RepID=A0AB73Q0G1_PSESS|nr:Bcr/CflA family multidrug efflux MFS transporter [Pseudomonas savastanoi]KPY68007.1 putative transport transmembrane protein [Pseudomonas savastanoi pv. savastanoi]KUG40657.1 putative transport transmembrane protein [Pseudomonas savastanoi pv. fraxini]PAB24949.1 MFS transporter [Pseudomonas savastanoi pv. nerii]PAB32324.1 MFS transporter [Pseudomonas savastanoi pv. fraxini]RML80777.1 putative transport transmembrane protein [Pseudomonas savastanoi pv. savastanoi]